MNSSENKTNWQYKIPFSCTLLRQNEAQGLAGQIVLFEEKGILFKFEKPVFLKVSEVVTLLFKLPKIGYEVKAQAKVIKTYDRVENIVAKEVQKAYITEMHFIGLDQKLMTAFSEFKKVAK